MKYQIYTRVGFSAACVSLLVAAPAMAQQQESEIEDVEEEVEDVEEEVQDLDPAEGTEDPVFGQEIPEVETAPPEYQEQPLIEEEFPQTTPETIEPAPPPQSTYPTQREMTEQERTWGTESIFPDTASESTRKPMTYTVTAGGGVTGFLDSDTRDATSVGGAWGARLLVGMRSPIAAEVAYLGSLQSVDTLGLDGDAKLLSNGGEVAARFNILQGPIQPYLLAGVGYLRYQLTDEGQNTSNVEDSDNVAHFPLAVGAAYRTDQGFVLDVRGVARPVASDSMFEATGGSMHSWGINLNAGAQF